MKMLTNLLAALLAFSAIAASAAEYPAPTESDFFVTNFTFQSGEKLPELRIHYRTLGQPRRDDGGRVHNAVLILHGTTGNGSNFLRRDFAGVLFGRGQLLDAERYFIILPDGIGHGKSSKPSDGLRAKFPAYGYRDMVEAQYRLLKEGLEVDHLRLVMGTSMGGMHTWLWAQYHPGFMDAAFPLASLPTQISGRNRVWRRIIIDAIRNDPGWNGGNYKDQPPSLTTALQTLFFMGNNARQRQIEMPTREKADAVLDDYVRRGLMTSDANDILYAVEASRDYDPAPGLEKIRAPLLAINFEDDLINPPELRILEQEIRRVPKGRAVMMPETEKTRGHGTHTLAENWQHHLKRLLKKTGRGR